MGQKLNAEQWEQIRQEYVSSSISYRDLAAKYGMNGSTLCRRALKEGWQQTRQQIASKVVRKADSEFVENRYRLYDKAFEVSELILNKIKQNIDSYGDEGIPGAEMKAYISTVKDIKEIGFFRSELDRAEQEARIRKLQKECEEERKEMNITVTFDEDEYAD